MNVWFINENKKIAEYILKEIAISGKKSDDWIEEACREKQIDYKLLLTYIRPYVTEIDSMMQGDKLWFKLNDEGCKFAVEDFWTGLRKDNLKKYALGAVTFVAGVIVSALVNMAMQCLFR